MKLIQFVRSLERIDVARGGILKGQLLRVQLTIGFKDQDQAQKKKQAGDLSRSCDLLCREGHAKIWSACGKASVRMPGGTGHRIYIGTRMVHSAERHRETQNHCE